MKNESVSNAKNALQAYVEALTKEQAERFAGHKKLLKLLPHLSENELIFTEVFLDQLFGGYVQ